jgi:hypothetical protein
MEKGRRAEHLCREFSAGGFPQKMSFQPNRSDYGLAGYRFWALHNGTGLTVRLYLGLRKLSSKVGCEVLVVSEYSEKEAYIWR